MLQKIWEFEPISRIELVDKTSLTSGTITNLTLELLKSGVIRETELHSKTVGRKRVMLRLDTRTHRLVGIDIGRNSIEIVLTDLNGRVITSNEMSTEEIHEPMVIVDQVSKLVLKLKATIQEKGHRLLGVGLSIPGPMNWEQGILMNPPNFPGWNQFPIRTKLQEALGMDVQVNDDARTSALAERWFGLGRKNSNLVLITLGIGIGGGVIMNGELHYGVNGLYGQIGHQTVQSQGERCACGNSGCWETIGSIPGILKQWKGGTGKTIKDFFEELHRHEPEAVRVWQNTFRYMTDAFTNIFNFYDPELIVLTGKLFPYFANELPRLRDEVRARVYPFVRDRVKIESSTFGTSQSAAGAASLVLDKLMKEPFTILNSLSLS